MKIKRRVTPNVIPAQAGIQAVERAVREPPLLDSRFHGNDNPPYFRNMSFSVPLLPIVICLLVAEIA